MGNKAAVDRLDDGSGSKVVARSKSGTPGDPEMPDSIGGPSRTRTLDPLIKSHFAQGSNAQHRAESAVITRRERPSAVSFLRVA